MITLVEIEECLKFRREYKDYEGKNCFSGTDKIQLRQEGYYIVWSLWGCEIYLNTMTGTWWVNDTSGA